MKGCGPGWGRATPGAPPQARGLYPPLRPWPKAQAHHRLAAGGRGTERVLRGRQAAGQVAVGHLSTWRAPRLLGQSWKEEAPRGPRGGSPPPVRPLPPPGGVEESLQASPPGISDFSRRAVHQAGSAPGDPSWGLAEVQGVCMHMCVQVCVHIKACVSVNVHTCMHVYSSPGSTLVHMFA